MDIRLRLILPDNPGDIEGLVYYDNRVAKFEAVLEFRNNSRGGVDSDWTPIPIVVEPSDGIDLTKKTHYPPATEPTKRVR